MKRSRRTHADALHDIVAVGLKDGLATSTLRPFVSLSYDWVDQHALDERGAGDLGLHVEADRLGVRLEVRNGSIAVLASQAETRPSPKCLISAVGLVSAFDPLRTSNQLGQASAMRALAVVFVTLLPTIAHGQDAVWRNHARVSCVGIFREECVTRTSACTRTNSDARWEIDFPRRSIRYVNANFSERIVALRDDSRGLSEAALLDSGRLLRFHRHDEEGAEFEASMLETNTGDAFAFTRFECRATIAKSIR